MTLSLREARLRETDARLAWLRTGMRTDVKEFAAVGAARRATDEALVLAVLRWVATEGNEICSMWDENQFFDGDGMSIRADRVLDAVEKGTDE